MPNIKSAIKRVDVAKKNNERNKPIRTKIATYIKKFKTAVSEKQTEESVKIYNELVSLLDSAASKNVIHKNKASRIKARLAKQLAK